MDWTMWALIGAGLLALADAIFGNITISMLRILGLTRAANWLMGNRRTTPNKPNH